MSRQGNRPGANAFTGGRPTWRWQWQCHSAAAHTHTPPRVRFARNFIGFALVSLSMRIALHSCHGKSHSHHRQALAYWNRVLGCVCVKVRFRDERQVSGRLAGWGVFYHLSTQTFATPLLDSSCAFVLSLTGTDFKWILISIRCYRTIYCGVCSSVLWFHRHNGLQLNMARSVDSVFRIVVQLRYHSDLKLTKENIW